MTPPIKTVRQYLLKHIWVIIPVLLASGGAMWGIAEAAVAYDGNIMKKDEYHLVLDQRYLQITEFKNITRLNRIQQLNDMLFQINFKINNNTATPLDKAMKERYENELRQLNQSRV